LVTCQRVLAGDELLSDRLEPVQRIEVMVLIQQLQNVGNAHGEAVVTECSARVVLLVDLFLRADHELNIVQSQ